MPKRRTAIACPQEFCNTYSSSFATGPEWKQYSTEFASMNPYLNSPPRPYPPRTSELTNLQFFFVRFPPYSLNADLWIDDVVFFRGPRPTP